MARWAGPFVEIGLWWGLCLGVWLLSLSAISGQDLYVATASALPCGVLAYLGRRLAGNRWRLRPGWFAAVPVIPLAIVVDTFRVLTSVLPGRARPGGFVRIPVGGATGAGPRPAGRRAIATLLVSITPASFVVDIDPDSGEALVHAIAGPGPAMERLATR